MLGYPLTAAEAVSSSDAMQHKRNSGLRAAARYEGKVRDRACVFKRSSASNKSLWMASAVEMPMCSAPFFRNSLISSLDK